MPTLPAPLTSVTRDGGATAVYAGATWGGQKAQTREQRTHMALQATGSCQDAGAGVRVTFGLRTTRYMSSF